MRKIYNYNNVTDIYINLNETSYSDPETQKWLWDEAKVVYSGTNTTPLMLKGNNVYLGWEDDGHICFDDRSLVLGAVYFQSLLRDGKIMLDNIQKEVKSNKKSKKKV